MFNDSILNGNDKKPATIVEEEEPHKKKRPQNLTGFTILDEKWKDYSSGDSDDSLPAGSYISSSQTAGRFCKSVDFRPAQRNENSKSTVAPCTLPNTPTRKNPPFAPPSSSMAAGGSRFKIVPVEARYKRDRWTCYDYYEYRDPFFTRGAKVSLPVVAPTPLLLKKEEVVNRSSRSLSDVHPVHVSSLPQKSLQNPPVPIPKPVFVSPKIIPKNPSGHSHTITNGSTAQASLKQLSPETLKGLESSLTEPRRTKSVVASTPVHHAPNIDSKIEQAMDLVKTHLTFAVREEIDGLRSKIFDLENHVHRLESENAILKRTIPGEVLKKLNFKL